ncbi:MAG: type III-B CRISPR module RAMP protein Cmr4 [Candidatus Schekmanbacteria bacterium]|nr:type III-B CRISPR module RAMP protein Cmr4 [Candidatus Schekmanbacteria bacterium]
MNARLLIVHALSPIHCGTGQAIGGIDLPIARERATGVPLIPGSSIKGVLRAADGEVDALHLAVFGPDTENAADHAGSVQFGDALLAFLPVRSLRGTFAWVTSPLLLRRLHRDACAAGIEDLARLPGEPREGEAWVTGTRLREGDRVIFEDLDFAAVERKEVRSFADELAKRLCGTDKDKDEERKHFAARVCVIHDDVMAVLLQTATEITARIRLDTETKTVAPGALWTEEALPVESVLVGLVVATPVPGKNGAAPDAAKLLERVRDIACRKAIQVGGNATVGRGLCRMRMEG